MSYAAPLPRALRRQRLRINGPLAASIGIACIALALIAYILRPQWPVAPASLDAPALPVTVGGVAFSVPPAAIRMGVQRRAGAHERIDLAFMWPSLDAPDGADLANSSITDRIFLTIAIDDGERGIEDRARTLYQRYLTPAPQAKAGEVVTLPFRPDSPYAGEDLVYVQGRVPAVMLRCSRAGAGGTPGTCLYDISMRGAHLTFRLSRNAITDWAEMENGFNRLLEMLVVRR